MKTFEVSSRKCKNGRRKFKAILHEIYPDSCVDTENECGTQYNLNGITWLRSYCEAALPTIKDMSLRVEFLDEERSEVCGHGETGIDNGLPLFEDATMIGHFTKGYIEIITDADGNEKTVCCGEGYIDEMCYHNYVAKLEEDVANDMLPSGSVEIYRTEANESIKYLYGYKKDGRIPTEFIYSGFALLGVRPADNTAQLMELNSKEENAMDMNEIQAIVEQTVAALGVHTAEMNECKASCETQVSEANAKVESITAEMNELKASSEQIQKALDEARKELEEKHKELSALYEEMDELREELGKAKARERIGELNSAISGFSAEEQAYATNEINAFKANPIEGDITPVTNAIYAGIGKNAKQTAPVVEQNFATDIDIFGGIENPSVSNEDVDIFA